MYAKVKETYSRKNSTFGPVLKFQMASILNVDTKMVGKRPTTKKITKLQNVLEKYFTIDFLYFDPFNHLPEFGTLLLGHCIFSAYR